eukprot:2981436-Prymnesium_polylepis.1
MSDACGRSGAAGRTCFDRKPSVGTCVLASASAFGGCSFTLGVQHVSRRVGEAWGGGRLHGVARERAGLHRDLATCLAGAGAGRSSYILRLREVSLRGGRGETSPGPC